MTSHTPDAKVELVARLREYRGGDTDWRKLMDEAANEVERLSAALRAARNPPRHDYWGAGEADCPREIKAGNGELRKLRCKVCGLDNPRDERCLTALAVMGEAIGETQSRWMIERDDLEFRPAYWRNSEAKWVSDWREGSRFSSRGQAEKMADNHILSRGCSVVRSHGLMEKVDEAGATPIAPVQDDDAEFIRGLKGAVPFNGGLVNSDLERLEAIAKRLSRQAGG